MNYTIDKMTEQHLSEVMAIEQSAFTHPWSLQNFKDSLRSGSIGLIMYQERLSLGYTVLMPVIDELHILNFAITPLKQHQGFGQKLLEEVIDFARQRHFKDIYLEVREENVAAHHLYLTNGFTEIGRRKGYYPKAGGREDAIVMRKYL
ncbi:MAG: ribosomal protein S18-alanine N-acetyltransferase [Betaproteobacteria bacterium]|nr:ribosomal protein S18-alanine N-acetyltransferase [Betaproteobacteria bacterium]